jgi:ATP-dependent Lon protease
MAQQLPHLEGVKTIPIFPLPVALFPGAILPLHIFEERYKEMIRDCMDGEKIFGVTFAGGRDGWPPPADRVGCAAFILAVVPLEEGRMNILTTGLARYRVKTYFEDKPYLEGKVEFFEDDPTFDDLSELCAEVTTLYKRTVKSIRTISKNDEDTFNDELPDEPEALSFSVASSLQLSDDQKIRMLELRSTEERLQALKALLQGVVEKYEVRALVHEKAKTNGHGSHKILERLEFESEPDRND